MEGRGMMMGKLGDRKGEEGEEARGRKLCKSQVSVHNAPCLYSPIVYGVKVIHRLIGAAAGLARAAGFYTN
jgi:hypothetical protein